VTAPGALRAADRHPLPPAQAREFRVARPAARAATQSILFRAPDVRRQERAVCRSVGAENRRNPNGVPLRRGGETSGCLRASGIRAHVRDRRRSAQRHHGCRRRRRSSHRWRGPSRGAPTCRNVSDSLAWPRWSSPQQIYRLRFARQKPSAARCAGSEPATEHDVGAERSQRSPGTQVEMHGIDRCAADSYTGQRPGCKAHRRCYPVPIGVSVRQQQNFKIAAPGQLFEQRHSVRRQNIG
jgi:hypothetical protein